MKLPQVWLIPSLIMATRYLAYARPLRIVVGKKLWPDLKLETRLKSLLTTLTAVAFWLNTKAYAASCRFHSFQQNTTHGLVAATRMKSCSASTRLLISRLRCAFLMLIARPTS